jgi:hypothetical protein
MSCCNKNHSKSCREKKCLKSLKEINELENKINIELEKAKLLLSLLNCENVDKIKQLIQTNFNKILMDEEQVAEWSAVATSSRALTDGL